jgi:hypothetical protein
MVEKWAAGLIAKGKKPTSKEKAEKFGELVLALEPDLTDTQLSLVRETAHAQKTKRSGKDGEKPT